MIAYVGFFTVILLANIIQGITGFAGTILAMPFSLMLVGYATAKPVLNVLGLLSGIYVYVGNRKSVKWSELKRIIIVMAIGIIAGIFIKGLFTGRESLLYKLLGVFVIAIGGHGFLKEVSAKGKAGKEEAVMEPDAAVAPAQYVLLGAAGIVHGMFVSGGPLLISYLTRRIRDKVTFRATISTVWIFLNTMILIDDLRAGFWNINLLVVQLAAIPFFIAGMFTGSKLYAVMSQKLFMKITYVLLVISGVSLFVK